LTGTKSSPSKATPPPNLLYAITRIRSIFRKAGLDPSDRTATSAATPPATDAELTLARKLTGFAATLQLTTTQLRPHFLCTYLYELAGQFSTFYNGRQSHRGRPGPCAPAACCSAPARSLYWRQVCISLACAHSSACKTRKVC